MSANIKNLTKKRGDKRRIVFHIVSKEEPAGVDLTTWTNFELVIDPEEFPPTNTNNVATLQSALVDTLNGKIGFLPTGTITIGNYFYNARGVDHNNERITFAWGFFNVVQDI